jgi:transcriptional regulator of acetoin/glycerol metabolism
MRLTRHGLAPLQKNGTEAIFAKLSLGSAMHRHGVSAMPMQVSRPAAIPARAVQQAEQPTPPVLPMAADTVAPTLRAAELLAIQAAVRGCGGNMSLAARQLGIGRSTLYRKLKAEADRQG